MARLVKAIDEFVAKHEKERMAGFLVLIGENGHPLQELAEKQGIRMPLTLCGPKPPGAYSINPKADVTVLVTQGKAVKARFGYAKAEQAEVDQVLHAAEEMLK